MAKKITLATFKSFVRKNAADLHILVRATFDGMTDGIEGTGEREFRKADQSDLPGEHTLGFKGIWLVGGSRDYFDAFEENGFRGIRVSNCCGNFSVAVPVK